MDGGEKEGKGVGKRGEGGGFDARLDSILDYR